MEHILDKTPFWVWILLVLVIHRGKQTLKDHQISLTKLMISPILFTLFSLYTVHEAFKISPLVCGAWAAAWVMGVIGALVLHGKNPASVIDRNKNVFLVPGTPLFLIISLLVFGARYALANASVFDPELLVETPFELAMLVVTGGAAGFLVGKFVSCWRLLKS